MSDPLRMSSPDLDESDFREVLAALRSGWLGLGPKAEEFETNICDYVNMPHAVAVSSGTAGLHLIVKSLALGEGDEVLVPSFTFAASVNVILYERARPVFVDIDPDTYNLSPPDVRDKIGPRTKAIMVVDVFGHPAEWDELSQIAREHDLRLIDDSCEALGAEYKGRRLGGFGDAAAFAFYPNKQMTTGEGGVVVTRDANMAGLIRSLRNQGRSEMGAWLEHARLGYNYRMNEMSAALGVSQLRRIESFLLKRDRVAGLYTNRLQQLPHVRTPLVRPDVRMSWFVYVVTLAEGLDRDRVMSEMQRANIPVRGYFPPVHRQPYIRATLGNEEVRLPVTESIARRTVALPFHNNVTESEIDRVVSALGEAIESVHAG